MSEILRIELPREMNFLEKQGSGNALLVSGQSINPNEFRPLEKMPHGSHAHKPKMTCQESSDRHPETRA